MGYYSDSGMINSGIIKYTRKSGIDEQRVGWKWVPTILIFYPTNSVSIPLFQYNFIIPLLLFLSSPDKALGNI